MRCLRLYFTTLYLGSEHFVFVPPCPPQLYSFGQVLQVSQEAIPETEMSPGICYYQFVTTCTVFFSGLFC